MSRYRWLFAHPCLKPIQHEVSDFKNPPPQWLRMGHHEDIFVLAGYESLLMFLRISKCHKLFPRCSVVFLNSKKTIHQHGGQKDVIKDHYKTIKETGIMMLFLAQVYDFSWFNEVQAVLKKCNFTPVSIVKCSQNSIVTTKTVKKMVVFGLLGPINT